MELKDKIEIGQLIFTIGVRELYHSDQKFNEFVKNSFTRYCDGDWGELCKEDKHLNELALKNGDDRLFAKYDNGDYVIYIITEWDRSYTTILFPEEY